VSRVPALQGKEIVRILKRFGFIEDHQTGSHLVMWQPQGGARAVVPMHGGKSVKRGLLFSILKEARISPEEFLKEMH
jgi:predicted RNA binding protein YcfA (HicA-like mRNA interferase family)